MSVTAVVSFRPDLHTESNAVYACFDKMKELGYSNLREDIVGLAVNSDHASSLVFFYAKSESNDIQCLVLNKDARVGWIMQGLETLFYNS